MADLKFDSVALYAQLNGIWTDLSGYVQVHRGLSFRWGMPGEAPDDIVANTGQIKFSLKNDGGTFYPDGGSALSGWGAGVAIKIVYTFKGVSYVRFKGYVPKNGIKFSVGKRSTMSYVDVTALDWMHYASDTPIIAPDILLDKTADEGLQVLVDRVPVPVSLSTDTGDYTFPAIFDSTGLHTAAYAEMAKLAYSESPGRIYLIKPRTTGEQLIFENSTHRDSSHPQKTTATITEHYLLNSTGGFLLNSTGGKITVSTATEADAAVVTFDAADGELDAVQTEQGENIINYATVIANPKRIDTEPQVLYRLPYAIPLAAGASTSFRAKYVDPQGGSRVNVITSSMLQPEAPGETDPNLMLLLHFTNNFTDSTGRHTITNNDVTNVEDVYVDVGPDPDVQRIGTNVLGPYAIFGGYASYNLSVPYSSDFEFGSGAFTIGLYAAILDNTVNKALIARDGTNTYTPWLLGYVNGTGINIYMSSNGSSWDIANAKSWGSLKRNRWTHYEINRDENGWFYAFVDGQLTDKWYSALAFPANAYPLSIGKWTTNYIFAGVDELYVIKGKALHKSDFTPPEKELSTTLEGDYLLNSEEDGTGTDLSDNLEIGVTYYSSYPEYTSIKNASGTNGHLIRLQARGRGVYSYDSIENSVEDAASIQENGYQSITINQPYQQDLTAGTAWITAIVADNKDAITKLRGISFWANKSETNMLRFLQCDAGDLIRVILDDLGIDGYFYIQNISSDTKSGSVVYVTWGLVPGLEPA